MEHEVRAEWFGPRLKELRVKAGLTQGHLAERSGLTQGGIANLEQGHREPAWSTILALCAALGVSCDAFLQQPADATPSGPGRPRKEAEPEPEPPAVKKRRHKRT